MAFISNGTTILDAGAFDVSLGSQILISEQTANSSASIEFTSGIDSTYDIYKFEFINIHPATDDVQFEFQTNAVGGSGYNETITSSAFRTYHDEADTASTLEYELSRDQAQGANFQDITASLGNDNDQSVSGFLILFNPSSTTYVKHFMTNTNTYHQLNFTLQLFIAGYFNTTSAIDEIKFQMNSGNIDAGTIKMYGIKGS